MSEPYDIAVIGGGINGAGIARDAAGRGLSVVLCEQGDLAEGTSSRSGKLIHGGLRYLEYYEFRLVREALIEREVLLASAPHIIWPMRFVLPVNRADRPAWLVRAGLFLYDHLSTKQRLPKTRTLNLQNAVEGSALKPEYNKAFEYSDCWVDDARLVVLNALDAAQRGASIRTRSRVSHAIREADHWKLTLESAKGTSSVTAKILVNAGGPWVNEICKDVIEIKTKRQVKLVKGSHIIVPKFWKGENAYVIQNPDKRLIFINPYEGNLALIGTTDIPYDADPAKVAISDEEIDYLIASVNRYFKEELKRSEIVESYSGVRPLFDDGEGNPSAVTRDYSFEVNDNGAPLLSVYGGKITTFRKLSEHAMEKLQPFITDLAPNWTASAKLPGGDIPDGDFQTLLNDMKNKYPWLPKDIREHYARLYGTRVDLILENITDLEGLGTHFGSTFYEAEPLYLRQYEWAETAEDILWRRTKYMLHLSPAEQEKFKAWLKAANQKGAAS